MSERVRRAVFLDRDGTLIEERDYLADPALVALVPGAARAVALLNGAGIACVVASNQSGIARGLLDERALAAVEAELVRQLERAGARLDLLLHCPHHPSEGSAPYRRACDCRKPAPGMLLDAARRLDLDLGASLSIGDMERDLQAGQAAGARAVLVLTGKGPSELARMRARGAEPLVARDLLDAVQRYALDPRERAPVRATT